MIALKDFWQKIYRELKANRSVILAMVMEKKGSAPRGVGAHMLILADGTTIDTIGGGNLEYLTVEEAKKNLKEFKSVVKTFSLTNTEAGNSGMVCGGQLKVMLYCFQPKDLTQVEKSLKLINSQTKFVININWQDDNFSLKIYDFKEDFSEKDKLKHKTYLQENHENNIISGKYFEVMKQSPRVFLFGGGYVAQEVAKLLPNLEFEYNIIEERIEFAQRKLFPEAKHIIVVDFADFAHQVEIKSTDYAIVVTNGHTKDTVVLKTLLKNPPCYIGVIGSKHKKLYVEKYLQEQGFEKELIQKIVMPIGLNIKADTPAEIAISIVAQLIQKRAE